jgi:hypothetical protein
MEVGGKNLPTYQPSFIYNPYLVIKPLFQDYLFLFSIITSFLKIIPVGNLAAASPSQNASELYALRGSNVTFTWSIPVTLDLSSSLVVISHLASPDIEDDGDDDDDNHHVNVNVTRSTYIKGVDDDLDDDDDGDDDSSENHPSYEIRKHRQEIETIFFASSTQSEKSFFFYIPAPILLFIRSLISSFVCLFVRSFLPSSYLPSFLP